MNIHFAKFFSNQKLFYGKINITEAMFERENCEITKRPNGIQNSVKKENICIKYILKRKQGF